MGKFTKPRRSNPIKRKANSSSALRGIFLSVLMYSFADAVEGMIFSNYTLHVIFVRRLFLLLPRL